MRITRAHGSVELEYLKRGGTYIHSVEVDAGFRGNGYGTRLLELALDKSRFPVYLLACNEMGGDTDRLIRWYGRLGFVIKRGHDIGYNYNMVRWE